jgi:hypothetical protein
MRIRVADTDLDVLGIDASDFVEDSPGGEVADLMPLTDATPTAQARRPPCVS